MAHKHTRTQEILPEEGRQARLEALHPVPAVLGNEALVLPEDAVGHHGATPAVGIRRIELNGDHLRGGRENCAAAPSARAVHGDVGTDGCRYKCPPQVRAADETIRLDWLFGSVDCARDEEDERKRMRAALKHTRLVSGKHDGVQNFASGAVAQAQQMPCNQHELSRRRHNP